MTHSLADSLTHSACDLIRESQSSDEVGVDSTEAAAAVAGSTVLTVANYAEVACLAGPPPSSDCN